MKSDGQIKLVQAIKHGKHPFYSSSNNREIINPKITPNSIKDFVW